jgi:Flp pilus assembly protein TadB
MWYIERMGIKRKDKKNAKKQVAADNAYYAERGEDAEVENSKRMVIVKAKYNKLPADKQKAVREIIEEYKNREVRQTENSTARKRYGAAIYTAVAAALIVFAVITRDIMYRIVAGVGAAFFLWAAYKSFRKSQTAKEEEEQFSKNYVKNDDFDDLLRMAYYDDDKFKRQAELRVLIEQGNYMKDGG